MYEDIFRAGSLSFELLSRSEGKGTKESAENVEEKQSNFAGLIRFVGGVFHPLYKGFSCLALQSVQGVGGGR